MSEDAHQAYPDEDSSRGERRRKRKKRSLTTRMINEGTARKKDLILSLIIVVVLVILAATGVSDRLWERIMSFFEGSPPSQYPAIRPASPTLPSFLLTDPGLTGSGRSTPRPPLDL